MDTRNVLLETIIDELVLLDRCESFELGGGYQYGVKGTTPAWG